MFDKDIIIVGSGPAGLSAAIPLAQQQYRVLVLEKEDYGGLLKKVEWCYGHPDYPQGIAGPELAELLITRAETAGVQLEFGEVDEIEAFSGCRSVSCVNGKSYTASAVILAGGRKPEKLGIPGEQEFLNKGVIHCVLCDAGLYRDATIAVCGGGDAGVIEALTMARHASRVIIIEQQSGLTARELLQDKARASSKIEYMFNTVPLRINGDQVVRSLTVSKAGSDEQTTLELDGVIVDVGITPETAWLDGIVDLDGDDTIPVDEHMEIEIEQVFAAGDIRTGSALNLRSAIADGETAAQAVIRSLSGPPVA
jgi:thioredoxin reductase (NADPH)